MSLVFALTSCGSEETPATDAPTADGTETPAETPAEEPAAETASASVVGNWGLENLEMPGMEEMMAAMGYSDPAQLEAAKAQFDEMITKMKESGALEIKDDASAIMTMINMQSGEVEAKEGTWSMSDDNKTFTLTLDGEAQAMEVTELTSDRFVMGVSEEGMSVVMSWTRK